MLSNQCTNEETNKIFEGMNILLKYYPNADIRLRNREIQFGDALEYCDYCDDTDSYSYFLSEFSNKDLWRLDDLGWFISKNTHRWAFEV